jgi:hypothetical protein
MSHRYTPQPSAPKPTPRRILSEAALWLAVNAATVAVVWAIITFWKR